MARWTWGKIPTHTSLPVISWGGCARPRGCGARRPPTASPDGVLMARRNDRIGKTIVKASPKRRGFVFPLQRTSTGGCRASWDYGPRWAWR